MSNKPRPRPGSANETVAPSAATRPGSSDDTIAPVQAAPLKDHAEPAAAIAPTSAAKPLPAETVAPGEWVATPVDTIAPSGAAGPSLATIDFSLQPPGLGATIESIPSLSSANRSSAAAPRPEVEGYTILSELGRGGMGVVYKARQKKLNRIVALKMVLAGAHAGADQLARFYTEAEAVAHLQQPNIVQIYEVAEHNGLPYFSLEFVDGGCLSDRIDGKPQPVKDAASMVERLARAIGYAHQQGIIHRDLKPANVLLTREGEPKITDFGLAKRLESDSSQTKSGTLMGTPNYMAPEQARGLVKEVGPLADGYALGVILYEMLTGRTPFLGTSILDTLQQVRNLDPVPPSRLQPKVPRDLETVCLKCLEKEPQKRYETAIALAEDLHRFIAGEPILARPVGLPERVWRWCQRNQRVAALSAAVLLLLVSMAIGGPVAAILISQKEKAARIAQAAAEANEKKADANAKAAEEQSEIAFSAFRTFVTSVNKLRDTAATQNIKQQLLRGGIEGLQKVMKTPKNAGRNDAVMAEAYQQMGDIFQSLGEHADARKQYVASYTIRKTLAEAAPSQFEPQREYAAAISKLGDMSRLEGHLDAALQHYADALRIREEIAALYPQNEQAKIDLGTSYVTLGNVSDPLEAKKYYLAALKQRQDLVASATAESRASRKRDVWIMSNRLAELSLKQSELTAALEHYEHAFAQAAELEELMQTSMRAKLDLAISHVHIGNVKSRQGDAAAAKDCYARALAIFHPLAREDAQNFELNVELALALARRGDYVEAAARADALRKIPNQSAQYNAACCYALCSAAVKQTSSGDQQKLSDKYAAQAIETLKQAIKLGFKDFAAMKDDHDLAAIAGHAGFLALFPAES